MANVISSINVEYIDHMGSDTRVANVARVSFAKWNEETPVTSQRDANLLAYLESGIPSDVRDNGALRATAIKHWSPFAHCFLSVRCTAPIALARQLVKHQVGLSWNEVSRRYTTDDVTMYMPLAFNGRPEGSIKQGCGERLDSTQQEIADSVYLNIIDKAYNDYNDLLGLGVAPEEARFILPLCTNTTWVWSGSLMAFMRVYLQRSDSHAQTVAREFADALGNIIQDCFPETFSVFTTYRNAVQEVYGV